ncbi:MAG: MFS transporter [Varibaculum sp.]|nr:MFS transporter [Varibaculum sp.]
METSSKVTSRALEVWLAAMLTYTLAVAARTSLGMASLQAIERFHLDATGLASFTTLQILVYGGIQIPMGRMLDRFGPRRLLWVGALTVAFAQVGMAIAPNYPAALAVRVLLGAGDATAFISVIRLLPSWFPIRRVPLFTQLTSMIGLLGQVISAYPFLGLVQVAGWSPAFLIMGGLGFAAAIIAVRGVADHPVKEPSCVENNPATSSQRKGRSRTELVEVFRNPWTWYGFFTHWSTCGLPMTFTLLWGVPFLARGMGLSAGVVSALMGMYVACNMVEGPIIGIASAARPHSRIVMILGANFAVTAAWIAVLWHREPPGIAWAIMLMIVLSAAGMISSLAFDLVRAGVPERILGTGIGTANMGGFVCVLLTVFAIGVVLDMLAPGGEWCWGSMRLAFHVQALTWVIGFLGVVFTHLRCRRTPAYITMR